MATIHASLSANIFPGYNFKLTAICPIVAGATTAFATIQKCHTGRAGSRLRLQSGHEFPIPSSNKQRDYRRILDLNLIPMATSPGQSPDRVRLTESERKAVMDDGAGAEAEAESRPMISGDSTYNGEDGSGGRNECGKQQPRRRAAAKPGKPKRQKSFSREIGHAAAETYLLTGFTITLLRYLGVGYRWLTRLAALCLYAALLMPGFLQVAYYYFFSSQVRRSIVYGDQPRNRLDLYIPSTIDGPRPVVAFVTGGAWIIGYKAWGSLLGQQLAERGIIVACIDYRNFPQGTIEDMVTDSSRGISFICNNIAEYGGDPNRIYLMGQSAGAHISACALLEQAIREAKGESTSWSASQIKAYFGLSGAYNLVNLVEHFNNRGLYRSLFLSIMGGEESLKQFSPEVRIQNPSFRDAVSLLPPIILFHGTADYSIPSAASETFVDALQNSGARAELVLFEGKTHTDLFLQDPLRGGEDALFEHLVAVIHADDEDALAKDAIAPPRRRLVPEVLLKLAGRISPF